MFKKAGPAEIVRSHQKDDYYLAYLRSQAADVCHSLLGARHWIKWRKEIDLLADLGYFCLTTVSGFQTIGEEYVNVVQVDSTQRALPPTWQRGLMVLLHCLTPYCFQQILDWLEHKLRSHQLGEIPLETREFMLKCIPVLRQSVVYVHRLHLAVFYISGLFYQIAKRFTGIRYIHFTMGPMRGGNSVVQTFKFLGYLTLTQIISSALLLGYRLLKDKSHYFTGSLKHGPESEDFTSFATADRKCSLCLEARKHSTATPCGHLFCWTCIHDWCRSKMECPLCREKFEQHRLVCLQNLDPP